MDFSEILTFIAILVITIVIEVKKGKKKQQQRRQPSFQEDEEEVTETTTYWQAAPNERESVSENEIFGENSSKSEAYFTYEEVADDEMKYADQKQKPSGAVSEKISQEVENEIETNEVDLSNQDELKKAVIYKAILENPYN